MHKARQVTLNNPSSSTARQKWQRARQEVQRTTRAVKNDWWIKKAKEIQSLADKNDMCNFHNAVKSIYGSTNRCINPIKTADPLKDQNSILMRWADHFETLLNQDSVADHTILDEIPKLHPIDNLDQSPTFLEVLSAVRRTAKVGRVPLYKNPTSVHHHSLD